MNLKRLIIILSIVVLAIAGAYVFRYKIMMKPARTTPAELKGIAVGEEVKVVCEIKEVEDDKLTLEVLTGAPEYSQRTGSFLEATGWKDAKIIMGKIIDVKKNDIAQFYGTKAGNNQISLVRIVILTKFIKGPPAR